ARDAERGQRGGGRRLPRRALRLHGHPARHRQGARYPRHRAGRRPRGLSGPRCRRSPVDRGRAGPRSPPVSLRASLLVAAALALAGVPLAEGGFLAQVLGGGGSVALTYIVSFVIALGILIFIHELGHFAVAKGVGVGVERFSLGFGPRLWAF